MRSLITKDSIARIAVVVIVVGFLLHGAWRYFELYEKGKIGEEKIGALQQSLIINQKILDSKIKENQDLSEALSSEQGKNRLFENQISGLQGAVNSISGTVSVLDKLRKTDPELLKKYSKVYFLSENYFPSQLSLIDSGYLNTPSKQEYFHTQALPFLTRMVEAAKGDGVALKIISAFRSFDEQAAVKSGYKIVYGSGANKFSADQGYSEHQLGTTCDFTTSELGSNFSKFGSTAAYKWLQENAYKFGFELSYPKGNTYYQYEPWHWRFVGVALAIKLHSDGKNFYDLTQREIDQYLVSIFD